MCETRIFMHTFNLNSISQMKKKIFSALLMGVFTLASMSMFVSCKDYDDDINNLDAEQQELLTRLQALEKSVSDNQASVTTQIEAVTKTANDALTAAQQAGADVADLKGLVDEATAAAKTAGEKAAAAETAAKTAGENATAAKEAAEEAKKDAADALAKAEEALKAAQEGATSEAVNKALADAKSALDQCADLNERLGKLETLAAGIPELIAKIEDAATKEELEAVKSEVQKYQDYFDSIFAMVTSVELYGTFVANNNNVATPGSAIALNFYWGTVKETAKFGDDEALDFGKTTVYATGDPVKEYTKGAEITAFEQGFIVRVNPVNATFAKEDVKVINSLGSDLSGVVEVTKVEPFNELITTRANGDYKTGLWKVYVQRVDGVSDEAFEAATETKDGKIAFAVTINNTDLDDTTDRYVASTFDLTVGTAEYKESSDLAFKVDGISYTELKNRWNGNKAVGEDNNFYDTPIEYAWSDDKKLSSAMVTTGVNANVLADGNDARSTKDYLPAEVGEPFEIELTTNYEKETVSDRVEWYYVVLDKNFGMSSQPSEWNAWISYGYEGLGVMTKASDKLKITVSQKDNQGNPYGDVIGFRVFAVNYDGTLVDPDGKAFYIQLGDASNVQNKTAEVHVVLHGENSAIIPVDEFASYAMAAGTKYKAEINKEASSYCSDDAKVYFTLYKDQAGKQAAKNWNEAKYVKVTLGPNANDFLDGGKFVAKYEAIDPNNDLRVVNSLTVTVTKSMPVTADLADAFKFWPNQVANNIYNCYLSPSAAWNATSTEGTRDLTKVADMKTYNTNDYYTWSFANAMWDASEEEIAALEVDKTNSYILSVDAQAVTGVIPAGYFIDSETPHATTITYSFDDISLKVAKGKTDNKEPDSYTTDDYDVDVVTDLNTIFSSPLNTNDHDYAWTQLNMGDDENPNMVNVNEIVYGETSNRNLSKMGDTYAKHLLGTNKYDNTTFGGTLAEKAKNIFTGDVKITIGDGEYYTVKCDKSTGDMTFTFVGDTDSNLTADFNTTMYITITDTYGHEYTYDVPFVIKKR